MARGGAEEGFAIAMGNIIIVHDDPLVEQCGYCDNGIQGDQYCRYCGGDGVEVFDYSPLATLAHNLAVAALGCAAFELGKAYGAERVITEWNGGGWTYPFHPGCGRSAL